jgi:hypothetical protein
MTPAESLVRRLHADQADKAGQTDRAQAVMDAFRALRDDEQVQTLRPGSQHRKQRIQEVLKPVADNYGLKVEDVAIELARMMDRFR